jgi:hypothetical protein
VHAGVSGRCRVGRLSCCSGGVLRGPGGSSPNMGMANAEVLAPGMHASGAVVGRSSPRACNGVITALRRVMAARHSVRRRPKVAAAWLLGCGKLLAGTAQPRRRNFVKGHGGFRAPGPETTPLSLLATACLLGRRIPPRHLDVESEARFHVTDDTGQMLRRPSMYPIDAWGLRASSRGDRGAGR